MNNPDGSFIWYELMTPDTAGAAKFYCAVVGWTFGPPQLFPGGMDYRMIQRSDGGMAGGVLNMTGDMRANGGRPMWLGYLAVNDVNATITAVVADGGSVQMQPITMEAGHIALLADPQGVPFYIMTPNPPASDPDVVSDVFSLDQPQRVAWNELVSPDLEGAKAFYGKHFGFEFNESMDMGPMGSYCFFDHDGQRPGAMVQQADNRRPAIWQFYFRVASIASAKLAVEANGGSIMSGPHEVPGGDVIVTASDPQGATFGLVGVKES